MRDLIQHLEEGDYDYSNVSNLLNQMTLATKSMRAGFVKDVLRTPEQRRVLKAAIQGLADLEKVLVAWQSDNQ